MLIIFDVDGTLTPSRCRIDEDFRQWLLYELPHKFVIVTGSDHTKTREQIGDELYEATAVYNCCGNHIFEKGNEIYRSEWRIQKEVEDFLVSILDAHPWPQKTGNHIEHRVGLCNFSILGRNATQSQRKAYKEYETATNQRVSISKEIMNAFPNIEVSVAGDTGIDIYKKGSGKNSILTKIPATEKLVFFGDRQEYPGNDYTLANDIKHYSRGQCYNVSDWTETFSILKKMEKT